MKRHAERVESGVDEDAGVKARHVERTASAFGRRLVGSSPLGGSLLKRSARAARRRFGRLALVSAFCGVAGCGAPKAEPTAEVGEPASRAARWIQPERPQDKSLLELPAFLRAQPESRGDVSTLSRVRIARVHVQAGARVEAGAPLVDVVAPEVLEAAAAYQGAAERARVHGQRAAALEKLLADGLVTQAQVFEQRTAERLAQAERLRASGILRGAGVPESAAGAILKKGVITLEAPVSGVLVLLEAYPGRVFEGSAAPLAQIVGEGALRVEARGVRPLPEVSSLSFVGAGGRVIALDPQPVSRVTDPQDGTERLWFAPKGAASGPDGLPGVVRVEMAEDVWQVPLTALEQTTGKNRLVRRRGFDARELDVEVLGSSGASALVRGELLPTDRVAAEFPRRDSGTERENGEPRP